MGVQISNLPFFFYMKHLELNKTMINDTNVIGNSSSIFKTIGLTIAGYTTPWLIKLVLQYLGIDLSGQETQIMQLLGVLIGLALSYVDMKYANSYFKKTITLEDYINYGVKHFNLEPVTDESSDDDGGP